MKIILKGGSKMDKSGCFLHNPGVMSSVLQEIITGGLQTATLLGASYGAMVAAIVLDGKIHLDAQAFGGDVTNENNPDRNWEGDPNVGINYVGYATGKVMQSMRTKAPSNEEDALGYGESDSAGSYREICFCVDPAGNKIEFLLLAAYSGMEPEEDLQIAQIACRSGWIEMSEYMNSDGSDTRLCHIVGNCSC